MQEILRQPASNPVDLSEFVIILGTVYLKPQADLHGMVDLESGTNEAEFAQTGIDIVNPTMRTIGNVTGNTSAQIAPKHDIQGNARSYQSHYHNQKYNSGSQVRSASNLCTMHWLRS